MKEQPLFAVWIFIFIVLYFEKIPKTLKFIWGYFLLVTSYQAYWLTYVPYFIRNIQPQFASAVIRLLAWNASQVFIVMVMYPIVILAVEPKFRNAIINGMKWFLVLDAILLFYGSPGFFTANTFDASLIACFALQWDLKTPTGKDLKTSAFYVSEWTGFLISMGAICYVHGRNAALIVAVSYTILMLLWARKNLAREVFRNICAAVVCIALYFSCWYFPKFMADPRTGMWYSFYTWWRQCADVFFGTGLGSFEWIGPLLDPGPYFRNQLAPTGGFFVMHNDWLQLGFDSGLSGLTLGLIGFIFVSFKLSGRNLATWLGIGVGMMFYYPTHAWPVQILALIMVTRIKGIDKVDDCGSINNIPGRKLKWYQKYFSRLSRQL